MAPQTPAAIGTSHRWFYNTKSGSIIHISQPPLAAVQDILPTWKGFDTQAEAVAYKKGNPPSIPIIGGIGTAIGQTGTALTDLNGFVSTLTQRATWIRIGEGVLGVILIAVGVMAMTRSSSVGQAATSTAVKAAKLIK